MIRLANSPAPHANIANQSVLHLPRRGSSDCATRSASGVPTFQPHILPADWDALFQAVQTRLETCVSHALTHADDLPLHERHETTYKAVLACVEDMRLLHSALIQERMAQQGKNVYANN